MMGQTEFMVALALMGLVLHIGKRGWEPHAFDWVMLSSCVAIAGVEAESIGGFLFLTCLLAGAWQAGAAIGDIIKHIRA